MQWASLRAEVQKAVDGEWKALAVRHPHLAEVIDQSLLVEQATASLGDDPAFREAMEAAGAGGVTAAALAEVVERFVGGWLRKLV